MTRPIDLGDQAEAGQSVIEGSIVVGWGLGGGEDGFSEEAAPEEDATEAVSSYRLSVGASDWVVPDVAVPDARLPVEAGIVDGRDRCGLRVEASQETLADVVEGRMSAEKHLVGWFDRIDVASGVTRGKQHDFHISISMGFLTLARSIGRLL
jgi:hypothetical protein